MATTNFDGELPQPGARHGSSGPMIFKVLREVVWPLLNMERRRLVRDQLHLARVTKNMKHVSTHTLDRKALRDGGVACYILLHTIWGRKVCQTRGWWSRYVDEAPELADALPQDRIPLPEFEDRPEGTTQRARYGQPVRRSRRGGAARAAVRRRRAASIVEEPDRSTTEEISAINTAEPASRRPESSGSVSMTESSLSARSPSPIPAGFHAAVGDPGETEVELMNAIHDRDFDNEAVVSSQDGRAISHEPEAGISNISPHLVRNTLVRGGNMASSPTTFPDHDNRPIHHAGHLVDSLNPASDHVGLGMLIQTAQMASDDQLLRGLISDNIASLHSERHYLLLSVDEYLRRMNDVADEMAESSRVTSSFIEIQRESMAAFHRGLDMRIEVIDSKIRSLERSLANVGARR